jgi:PAS domain S-box-containing protein
MLKILRSNLNTLPMQMIFSFIGLTLLTAVASGLPAIWLLRNQLERQAWAQVEQGSRAAQALYLARQNDLANLATLTAQRPTLYRLVTENERAALPAYLETLQTGADLDLIVVCAPNQQMIALAGVVSAANICQLEQPVSFQALSTEPAKVGVWLLAAHPIGDEPAGLLGQVVVGVALDNAFAEEMRQATGLDHSLFAAGRPISSNLAQGAAPRTETSLAQVVNAEEMSRLTFSLDGNPYYAIRFPLNPAPPQAGAQLSKLEAETALAVANIFAPQQRLVWTLAGSILVIAGFSSILGALLARRISRPLDRLANAAATLSQGDLDKPIVTDTRVREVALVGWALEAARLDLRSSLTDLQREKAWTDHLLEAVVEGIITLDQQGRVIFFSRGAERLTGWSREQALGRSYDEIFQPAETDAPFSHLLAPSDRQHKIALRLRSGRQVVVSVTGAKLSLPENGDARQVLVFRDVSEEEAVHRLLGHFLANIAHEFRTPLSALAASVELLRDQAADLNPAELQELLNPLHLGVLGLQTLIDNLLESASIEAGRFRITPRPSDLAGIIGEVSRTIRPLLLKRGQSLRLELPSAIPPAQVDPRRTAQVLVNLLSNASRYSPDETEIVIKTVLAESWLEVMVIDQGPGILPEYHQNLFHRFVHDRVGHDKTDLSRGTGLGLSVVKAVVEAQGGQVGVGDAPGGGTIFWFTLPIARSL